MSWVTKDFENILSKHVDFDKLTEDIYREYAEQIYEIFNSEDLFKRIKEVGDIRGFSVGSPVYDLEENGTDSKLKVVVRVDTYDSIEELFVLELKGAGGTHMYTDIDLLRSLIPYSTGIDGLEVFHPILTGFRQDIGFIENLSNY